MGDSLRCRICLLEREPLISLEDEGNKLKFKLEIIIPELEWQETFRVCDACSKELDVAFNFRTKCLQSYEKILASVDDESEKDDEVIKEECDSNDNTDPSSPIPESDRENDEADINYKIKNDDKQIVKTSKRSKQKKISIETPKRTRIRTTLYTCQECEFTCNNTTKLIKHCEETHNMSKKLIKPYSCPKCEKRFKTSTNLKQHLKYHKGTRSEICTYCGKGFITKPDLFVHEKIHFNKKTYSCEICHKSFNTHKNLGTHKLIVHTDPSLWNYVCNFCNKRFPQKSNMTAHVRRHKGEKLFECHLCQKKFYENGTLKKHIVTHSNVRNNRCSECGKEYRERRVMEIHMAKVHGIGDVVIPIRTKKFVCHICSKAYYDRNKLTRHLYTHTGEKPFRCEVCDKGFIDKSYLANHVKNTHMNKSVTSVSIPVQV
ncbi:zinc finger protein 714-like [Coccinella septempunctata]|uniref:zinc finger protein 714-like n=1 Tax=Coccinella septempunctata TaxID=41139 RepID=UPI001D07044A|nr:zinc finger protein 714-like [Coccinella septempunctata]